MGQEIVEASDRGEGVAAFVLAAAAFNLGIWAFMGPQKAEEVCLESLTVLVFVLNLQTSAICIVFTYNCRGHVSDVQSTYCAPKQRCLDLVLFHKCMVWILITIMIYMHWSTEPVLAAQVTPCGFCKTAVLCWLPVGAELVSGQPVRLHPHLHVLSDSAARPG